MLVGQTVLAGAGFSTILPELDFETYSEAGCIWDEATQTWDKPPHASKKGLTAVGTYNYVLHPSFRIIQLAYNLKDGYGARIWRPEMPAPQPLFDWIARYTTNRLNDWDGLLESWNNFFEVSVWILHCTPALGWPSICLGQMRDAMVKAAINAYPRKLDNAAKVLNLVNQKDKAGNALINKLTMPRNPTKKNPAKLWTRETAPVDFMKFDAYNVQDIMTESEASAKLPDLSPRELEFWQVDQVINHRGMQLDLKAIDDSKEIIRQAEFKYNSELQQITGGAVKSHNKAADMIRWLARQGVYVDSVDEDSIAEQLKQTHNDVVLRVLRIRQLLSFGSVKKLYGMSLQAGPDGRLRDMFAFAAAHTHMWNGVGPQVMNLYKSKFNKPEHVEFAISILASRNLDYVENVFRNGPPWKPDGKAIDALEVIANCIRSMIIAKPGHRLMIADYNAIQAVITAAIAGEKWQLDVFHTHGKIYEMTASKLTGKPLQFYLDYRNTEGKHHEDRQNYGKIPTLANGFGAWIAGWRRFDDEGLLGSDAEVKSMILKMWAASPNTCELWGGQTRNKFGKDRQGRSANEYPQLYGLEGAAISAVKYPGTCYGYRGVMFQTVGDDLYCQVPGGGSPLIYHNAKLSKAERQYSNTWELALTYEGWNTNATKGGGGWQEMDLYGGVLTQNAVAKTHRGIQASTLVALEQTEDYKPVHHAHDENTCEVANGRGSKEEYLAIVNDVKTRHPWAVDDWGRPWPIKAPSADEAQRYGRYE